MAFGEEETLPPGTEEEAATSPGSDLDRLLARFEKLWVMMDADKGSAANAFSLLYDQLKRIQSVQEEIAQQEGTPQQKLTFALLLQNAMNGGPGEDVQQLMDTIAEYQANEEALLAVIKEKTFLFDQLYMARARASQISTKDFETLRLHLEKAISASEKLEAIRDDFIAAMEKDPNALANYNPSELEILANLLANKPVQPKKKWWHFFWPQSESTEIRLLRQSVPTLSKELAEKEKDLRNAQGLIATLARMPDMLQEIRDMALIVKAIESGIDPEDHDRLVFAHIELQAAMKDMERVNNHLYSENEKLKDKLDRRKDADASGKRRQIHILNEDNEHLSERNALLHAENDRLKAECDKAEKEAQKQARKQAKKEVEAQERIAKLETDLEYAVVAKQDAEQELDTARGRTTSLTTIFGAVAAGGTAPFFLQALKNARDPDFAVSLLSYVIVMTFTLSTIRLGGHLLKRCLHHVLKP